ncbi:MAG: aminotransferase class I/II-fold pyridoxal phosphate-dependent enzyme [Candidatus Poseidoniaceae archaeon]|nr:aminotransferase class I/II-fold pyridoxal phosphate-dependent enzyme [Candidatus Poseidoniaceae archaeon]
MSEGAGGGFLNAFSQTKVGNDTIFSWWARYQEAVSEGHDAVNGTIGALLEDNGELAINNVVDKVVRESPPIEIAAYAPLKGLPAFLDLCKTLALGDMREELENIGVNMTATASPGGSGALFLAAANFADRGDRVLLRDRHWGPYDGFLAGCDLGIATYPLLPSKDVKDSYLDLKSLEKELANLCNSQKKVMSWLNDPAHNPTGLSLTKQDRYDLLKCFIDSSLENQDVSHTLLIDAAYHLYAEQPHGWADTICQVLHDGISWPDNLLVTFALSLSKSHTIYGLRTGALVSIHPDKEVTDRMATVMGVTGRQTWSATSRLAQYAVSHIHNDEKLGDKWDEERERLQHILENRRKLFIEECQKLNVPVNPTHDGFFAWMECDDPIHVANECAKLQVYLVPLTGGVRIGLCAIPTEKIARVAQALSQAFS